MTISAAERSRINSQNGRKGGPKSLEGKQRSSQNAFKHGLRAETLCLPNENPEELQAKLDEWHGFYQPRSPAECEFINKAVLSLQQSDRLRRYQDATLADRVRDARDRWDEQREDEVARLAATLEDDPAAAVRKLKRTAAGCRWLLTKWADLKEQLDEHGWWTSPTLLHRATRLMAMRPEDSSVDADVYLIRLMNLSVEVEQNRGAIVQLMTPPHVPDTLRDALGGRQMKPDYCRRQLAELVEHEMSDLRSLEDYLRTTIDEPSLAGAEDRALVLDDESGRLLHRYSVAAENSFHRAYQNFLKARAKEEGLIDSPPETVLPNEPNLAVESAPRPLPNEPNLAPEPTRPASAEAGAAALPNEPKTSSASIANSGEPETSDAGRGRDAVLARQPDDLEGHRGKSDFSAGLPGEGVAAIMSAV